MRELRDAACCQAVGMDRLDMATTARRTGDRPRRPLTRDLRCGFGVPSAPPPGGLPGSPASLFIYVQDVDAVIARAAELGAKVQRPAEDQFYGDRDGHIIDPFGHGWTVASHVEDVTPDEMTRRMAELFG